MKIFQKYFSFLLFFSLPIFIANIYYIDDLGRATSGYTRWGVDGRPVSDIVMIFINMNQHLSDTFPLPLIISLCLLSSGLVLFRNEFLDNSKISGLLPLAFLSNIYFVEILSYRFDVLPIMVGVFTSFVFFASSRCSKYINALLPIICVVIIFSTYQATINIVLVLCVLETIRQMNNGVSPKITLKTVALRIIQLAVGALVYLKAILPITFNGEHNSSHPEMAANLIDNFISNVRSYANFIDKTYFFEIGYIVFGLLYVISLLSAIIVSKRYSKCSESNLKYYVIVLSLIGVIVSPILSMFSVLFLEKPLTSFSRVYIGIGGYFLLTISILYYAVKDSKASAVLLLAAIPFMYSINNIFAYGNAIHSQSMIDKEVVREIKSSTSNYDYNTLFIVFNGSSIKSPVLTNSINTHPLFKYLIVDYFSNWYWPFRNMMFNGYAQLYPSKQSGIVEKSIANLCTFHIESSNQDFILRIRDNIAIVDFKKTKC